MECNEVWKDLINAIHGKKNGRRNVNGKLWKDICKFWEDFKLFTRLEVGMELAVSSGQIYGLESNICLKDKFPTLFNCSTKRNGNVADFHSNSGW